MYTRMLKLQICCRRGAKALKAVMTARQKILETTSSGMYSVVFSVTIMTLYNYSNSNGIVYYLYNNHAI